VYIDLIVRYGITARPVTLQSFNFLAFQNFYKFSYHTYQFQEMIPNINYVFLGILKKLSIKFLILKIIQSGIIINVHRSSFKVHVTFFIF